MKTNTEEFKVDRDGRNKLHHAAFENNVILATQLLTSGINPDSQDKLGYTPLHFTAQHYSVDVAKLLIQHGANVNIEDNYGNTPLGTDVFNSKGKGEMIKLLIANKADINHTNKAGKTPLTLANLIANYDVAQYFNK